MRVKVTDTVFDAALRNVRSAQASAVPFSVLFQSIDIPIVVTDARKSDDGILFVNDAFLALTGYERQDCIGRNCRFLQGPDTDPATIAAIGVAIRERRKISVDVLNYRRDGSTFWNGLFLSPVPNAHGETEFFFATQSDATERKQRELNVLDMHQELERLVKIRTDELERALSRSTLLMHEVDHRVKNNLQMISAMLMMQSLSIPDPRIRDTLQEMLERVEAMGLVHKQLYQSDNLTAFDVGPFARNIAENLVAATGRTDIELKLDVESATIGADDAAAVALMINETITNAIKHGIPREDGGTLDVTVRSRPTGCEITVRDEGPGMPRGETDTDGFGGMLLRTLAQQVKATISWAPSCPGTVVTIHVPSG